MEDSNKTHQYNIRLMKWGISFLDKPIVLSLNPNYVKMTDKDGNIVFESTAQNLEHVSYNYSNGLWEFKIPGQKVFRFQTHGIWSFANWGVRKTDVNEKLGEFMNLNGVPFYSSGPVVKAKKW
jgi:hypothetical protein